MAGDLIRETRDAALTWLKSDQRVTALVPAASLYSSTTPAKLAWPFTRFDAPQSIPRDLACVAGATVTWTLHGFARGRYEGDTIIERAEDFASRIGSALKLSLHNRRLPVADATALYRVTSVRLLQDGDEAGAYHSVLSLQVKVLAG